MQLAMVQDRLMPLEALPEPYLDRAMFFGDGVYEVLRSYHGRLFALDDHMARFAQSLEAIDLRGIDVGEVGRRVVAAYAQSGIADAKVYFHATRGSGPRDMIDTPGLRATFFMTITELEEDPADKRLGIAVCTHPDWRWKRCHIKSLNLLPNVLARREAQRRGCREAILVSEEGGLITEGSGSTFFALIEEPEPALTLRTSPLSANVLPSVTRTFVLKAAAALGLKVEERSLTCAEAAGAAEMFIAMTTHDIVPVVEFDGRRVGSGRPGPMTRRLVEGFHGLVADSR